MSEENANKKCGIFKRVLLKLTSFKNIVCIWCMFIFTYMLVTKQEAFASLGWGLLGIIGGCIGVNVLQKKLENK